MADFAKASKADKRQADTQSENPAATVDEAREKPAPRSFFSLSDVQVHYNSEKPARLGALAYTQDAQVYIAPGQRQVLRHELGHVIQQKRGQIPVRRRLGGIPINDDPALEAQADRLGASAFPRMENLGSTEGGAVQCWKASVTYIRDYATKKGFPELPDVLVERLVEFINGGTLSMFTISYWLDPLNRLDPFFDQLGRKRKALHDEAFQTYLMNVDAEYLTNLGTPLREMWNTTTLDTNPHKIRDGETIRPAYGPYYSITYSDIIDLLEPNQRQVFFSQINILQQYCQQDGINSVVEGAAINVKLPTTFLLHEGEDLKRALTMFIHRLHLMTDYIRQTGEKKEGGQVIKSKYWIKSTGSDPHAGGQHALFLIDRLDQSEKRLYKPHSLQFENAVLGVGGVIDQLNSVGGTVRLPTMGFRPDDHTEDYIEHYGDYDHPLTSTAAVEESFFKLGALEAVMKMTGITDLHAENIMFTKDGPIPIDAECGANYGATGITGNSAPGNTDEGSLVNPSALYLASSESSGKRQVLRRDYQPYFDAGKKAMERVLYERKDTVLQIFSSKLQQVDSCRILPFSTDVLAGCLDLFVRGVDPREIAEGYLGQLIDFLHSRERAYYHEGMILNIIGERYHEGFIAALQAGTLPAFSIQFQRSAAAREGTIWLDDTTIGLVTLPYTLIDTYIAKATKVIHSYGPVG